MKKAKWTPPKPPVPFSSRDDLSEMEIEGKVTTPPRSLTQTTLTLWLAPLNEKIAQSNNSY